MTSHFQNDIHFYAASYNARSLSLDLVFGFALHLYIICFPVSFAFGSQHCMCAFGKKFIHFTIFTIFTTVTNMFIILIVSLVANSFAHCEIVELILCKGICRSITRMRNTTWKLFVCWRFEWPFVCVPFVGVEVG
jgi:hypothetical protein